MTHPLVSIDHVSKRFAQREALIDVSLHVPPGEIVGLIGPNGSGKTTLLKILAGGLRPDGGRVRIFGLDPYRDRPRVMQRARFAFAPPALFESLTPREHLEHLGGLGASRPSAAEIDATLELVGLGERARDRVATFSFGMRQRLILAQALLPRPELLVLDEPSDGLDPAYVVQLRAMLMRLRDEHGVTVLLSSHLLGEVEELVSRMLWLSEGRTRFLGSPAELLRGRERIRLRAADLEVAVRALQAHGIESQVRGPDLFLPPDACDLPTAQAWLSSAGTELQAFHIHRPTLEAALCEEMGASTDPSS